MPKILMIDDDLALCHSLAAYCSQFDLELIYANTPSDGLLKLQSESPQLLLLDVMMPEMDGFTLCKKIRLNHSLPIIMLTARGQLNDKITGLELGADDYVAKPFEPRELVARIQVLLRRLDESKQSNEHADAPKVLMFDGITLHPEQCRIEVDGNEIKLTGMEFSLLNMLASNTGKVFSRDQVISELKGIDVELYSRSVDILLSRLRQKLNDDPQQPRFIKTLRNVGYTFVAKKL
ncbi:response regulator transcription factor [Thalassotalea sp. HSM 43]|uniref:response regulator transcription factor n=1 Tax=Thalassotalea sp. HSM 43 TaxID=2552945 RepID=UPI00108000E9|nr:response regulator transcription factor [Thalassotalea sp. HSM 43]QBY04193.1 response regulator transcription factor [Thalassotalea sp. HSM 43]